MPSDVNTLIAHLQSIYEHAPNDQASRQRLYDATQSLALKLEGPGDTMQRICYLASHKQMHSNVL